MTSGTYLSMNNAYYDMGDAYMGGGHSYFYPLGEWNFSKKIKQDLYKTELCKNKGYIENGICTYGERCVFAHGRREIQVKRNPKYKTKICDLWEKSGRSHCPYESRCNFVHFSGMAKESREKEDLPLFSSENRLSVFARLLEKGFAEKKMEQEDLSWETDVVEVIKRPNLKDLFPRPEMLF